MKFIIAIIVILLIVGAAGVGLYFTDNLPFDFPFATRLGKNPLKEVKAAVDKMGTEVLTYYVKFDLSTDFPKNQEISPEGELIGFNFEGDMDISVADQKKGHLNIELTYKYPHNRQPNKPQDYKVELIGIGNEVYQEIPKTSVLTLRLDAPTIWVRTDIDEENLSADSSSTLDTDSFDKFIKDFVGQDPQVEYIGDEDIEGEKMYQYFIEFTGDEFKEMFSGMETFIKTDYFSAEGMKLWLEGKNGFLRKIVVEGTTQNSSQDPVYPYKLEVTYSKINTPVAISPPEDYKTAEEYLEIYKDEEGLLNDEEYQKDTRDFRRITDINTLISNLDRYQEEKGTYPLKITEETFKETTIANYFPQNPEPGGMPYTYLKLSDDDYALTFSLETEQLGYAMDLNEITAKPREDQEQLFDTDGDYITDTTEGILGTDPKKKDTDGDGFDDTTEIQSGYDPLK